ncbi:MAG: hypothetical protein BAA03_03565 [Caldibacillus debilis]|nr:MAG: hypothetical protein BAA03_03565 [Caldibacillus debilis]
MQIAHLPPKKSNSPMVHLPGRIFPCGSRLPGSLPPGKNSPASILKSRMQNRKSFLNKLTVSVPFDMMKTGFTDGLCAFPQPAAKDGSRPAMPAETSGEKEAFRSLAAFRQKGCFKG